MLKIINNFQKLSFETNSVMLNAVRWRRKPRKPMWKGTAKSKIFRIPQRPQIPIEEKLELQRLFNKYRTEVKTINRFLVQKYNTAYQQKDDDDAKIKEFEEDFVASMKLNDEWNEKQKIQREARQEQELKDAIELAKQRKSITANKRIEVLEHREEIVKKEKEAAKSFVHPSSLDEVIEKSFSNLADHNFAINLDGEKITNKKTVTE